MGWSVGPPGIVLALTAVELEKFKEDEKNLPGFLAPSDEWRLPMSNLAVYMIGIILVIAGGAWAAHQVGISQTWIAIGILVILGIGLASGVGRTRRRESPPTE